MASDFNTSPVGIFFESLRNIRSDLPYTITSKFDGIKKKLENEKYQSWWSFPTLDSILLLDDLNDALAECHILKQQRASIRKKTNLFSRSEHNTLQNIRNLLSSIDERIKIEELNANSRSSGTQSDTNFLIPRDFAGVEAVESPTPLYYKEKEKIVDCLGREGFKAIGICGMCGSGKTVLVDEVLENEKVLEMFCPIIRVCLSDIPPKEQGDTKVVKHLLEALNYDVDELTGSNRHDVDLVDVLEKKLMARKFLIVLDDLWFLSGIVNVLPQDSGGAVIVTSRMKHVAEKMVHNECLFHLKPWKPDEGKLSEDVDHIHGLPLAAKVLTLLKVQEVQQQHT